MSGGMFIGAFAKRCGRSIHTIRWYETQGLIPNVGRDGGGRRVYEPGHVEHLIFLERMRRSGMSVAEMRALTDLGQQGWRTLPARMEMLRLHRLRVEAEIADLTGALSLIDEKIGYYEDWAARKKRPPPLPAVPDAKEERRSKASG